jgi:hypothetical protein
MQRDIARVPLAPRHAFGRHPERVAVCRGTANAKRVLEDLKAGGKFSECHFIEFMACPGGCLGGGEVPIPTSPEIRAACAQAIYTEEASYQVRKSHENPALIRLYREFLTDGPCGHTSHHLLHTHYVPPGTYLDRSGGSHGHPLRGALRASTLLPAAEVPSEPLRSRDVTSGSLTFRAALTPRRDSSAARSSGYPPCEAVPGTVESHLSLWVLSHAGADRWILRGARRAPHGFC